MKFQWKEKGKMVNKNIALAQFDVLAFNVWQGPSSNYSIALVTRH